MFNSIPKHFHTVLPRSTSFITLSPMSAHLQTPHNYRDAGCKAFSFSPDPDAHRGRKRHRSLTRGDAGPVKCGSPGGSSAFRGRPRRRSTSPIPLSSRNPSNSKLETSRSPAQRRSLLVVVLDRRRSQSPSRSRSPNQRMKPPRRRQRTRSRSRSHNVDSYVGNDGDADLRLEVLRQSHKSATEG